jgi:hypothetical protein
MMAVFAQRKIQERKKCTATTPLHYHAAQYQMNDTRISKIDCKQAKSKNPQPVL